jgi:hypothetical protein
VPAMHYRTPGRLTAASIRTTASYESLAFKWL